jgi:hypothetical protein
MTVACVITVGPGAGLYCAVLTGFSSRQDAITTERQKVVRMRIAQRVLRKLENMKTDGPSGEGCAFRVEPSSSRRVGKPPSGQHRTSCVSCALTILWAPEIWRSVWRYSFPHPMSRMAATIEQVLAWWMGSARKGLGSLFCTSTARARA